MKRIITLLCLAMAIPMLFAQDLPDDLQLGKHSVAEWKHVLDTTWGEGMETADKLLLFDRFWEAVNRHYPGFVNNPVNWDSVKNHYRPEIEAGVSKGRFAGIIGKMGQLMREPHSGAINKEVYETEANSGVPLLVGGLYMRDHTNITILNQGRFGAAVVLTAEDELVVLRAVENHPMGLEAGDKIIGYDGTPWKEIYPGLLRMEFPVTSHDWWIADGLYHLVLPLISNDENHHHFWMTSVGLNWHLFDTLDFVKYGSGEILHAPTHLLEGMEYSLQGNRQLRLDGIEFPGDVQNPEYILPIPPVIYDTLDNRIGYVYSTHETGTNGSREELKDAVDNLKDADIEGIVFDLRFNMGGYSGWDQAFNSIFTRNFTNYYWATRSQGGGFSDFDRQEYYRFVALSDEFYAKPIALLTSPETFSMGDYLSHFMNLQPNVRIFGSPGAGGLVYRYSNNWMVTGFYPPTSSHYNLFFPDWVFEISNSNFVCEMNGEMHFMIGNSCPVDEPISFTQEAAYNQVDNIAERAMDWIRSVAYIDSAYVDEVIKDEGEDFMLHAHLTNPKAHSIALDCKVIERPGMSTSSQELKDDGQGADNAAGDGIFSSSFPGNEEGFFAAEIEVYDDKENSTLGYPGIIRFTNVPSPFVNPGVLELPSEESAVYDLELENSSSVDITGLELLLTSDDPAIQVNTVKRPYGDLAPGASATKLFSVECAEGSQDGTEFSLTANISSEGFVYWMDPITLSVVSSSELTSYEQLIHVYPNPSDGMVYIQNTTGSFLNLRIFNLGGQCILRTELRNGQSTIDLSAYPKGVYLIRMKMERGVVIKKLIIR